MNNKLQDILEMPLGHRIGILAGTVVVIGVLFYFMLFSPLLTEQQSLSKKVDELNAKKSQQETIARNLKQYLAEVQFLDVELNKALKELPDKREIDQLLLKVSDKAKDSGLDVRLFKPRPEEKKDFYAAVPVDIEVVGGYHQVATFFDEVGHLDRIVNLDQFAMSDPVIDRIDVVLKTSVVATAFRFLEESERPKPEEQKDKRRKRKANDE